MLPDRSFQPKPIDIFLSPIYLIRRGLYKLISKHAKQLKGDLLDFGCGSKPYENLFTVNSYTGIDIEISGHNHNHSKIDVFYDGKKIPFEDNKFDSIFASEVFEHVFNLDEILLELNRVLKPGGKILITIPFAWPEHEAPYDFARYTSFGIESKLQSANFDITTLDKNGNFITSLVQLTCFYLYSRFQFLHSFVRKPLVLLFIIPTQLAGYLLAKILPTDKTYFMNCVIIAQKKRS